MGLVSNMKKPAPRWFRKFKRAFGHTENFVIGILLLNGFTSDAPIMLMIKMGTSFVLEILETFSANGEEYEGQR